MSFTNFLNDLFVNSQRSKARAGNAPANSGKGPAMNHLANATDNDYFQLMASKAMHQLRHVDKALNLGQLPDNTGYHDAVHDVAVMLRHHDLSAVSLQALGAGGEVLFEFKIAFSDQRNDGRIIDSGKGVEVPLLDRSKITGGRWLLCRKGNEHLYKHLLTRSYGPAPHRPYATGSTFESEHSGAITGGRQSGSVRAANNCRMLLTITNVGGRGYAFATNASGEMSVFCHARHAATGMQFKVGQRITAFVVQVPRGLQGRDIRPAQ